MADYNEESREVETNKDGGITVKIDVDVSEALTGLKAVTREAREATKAVKALESLDGNTKINLDTGDYSIGSLSAPFSGFKVGKTRSDVVGFRPLNPVSLKYYMSDVSTAQLVEELASRDGVDKVEFEAGSEVFINGRKVRFLTPGYVIDGCYEGSTDE